MVQEYNTGAFNQGILESEMHAVVGNLIDASVSVSSTPDSPLEKPEFYDFDIAAVGLGWHHFTDPAFAAKQLSKRLKVGGTLLIIDFLPHGPPGSGHKHDEGHSHGHGHGHAHSHAERKGRESERVNKVDGTAAHTVMHWGFAEEDIKKMYEEAGVGVDFDFVVLGKGIVFEGEGKTVRRTVFMARGRKG